MVTAIAADPVDDMRSIEAQLPGVRLVSDPKLVVSNAWKRHVDGSDSPTPGTFVVAADGTIEWQRLPDAKGNDWPTYAELSAALKL